MYSTDSLGKEFKKPYNYLSDSTNNIKIINLDIPTHIEPNKDIQVTGIVKNNGNPLTSVDVTYKINNEEFVSTYTQAVDINNGKTATFMHNLPIKFRNDGIYNITVKVSGPTGEDDSLSHTIKVSSNSIKKMILLEQFTTERCGNCPAGTDYMKSIINSRDDVVWVCHHAGYYTDQYTMPISEDLTVFFNSASTYAPAAMLDRQRLDESEPGPVMGVSKITTALLDQLSEKPAYVAINIGGNFNETSKEISLTVSGEFVDNAPNSKYRLNVFLLEDGIISTSQSGSNPYTHNNLIRYNFSLNLGDDLGITEGTAGATFSKNYTTIIDNSWNVENLKIVAFITNWNLINVNKREVLNASKKNISDLSKNSLQLISNDNIKVFPNPANSILTIESERNSDISIFNMLGQEIITITNSEQYQKIDVSNIENGTYIVKITNNNTSVNKRIIISK